MFLFSIFFFLFFIQTQILILHRWEVQILFGKSHLIVGKFIHWVDGSVWTIHHLLRSRRENDSNTCKIEAEASGVLMNCSWFPDIYSTCSVRCVLVFAMWKYSFEFVHVNGFKYSDDIISSWSLKNDYFICWMKMRTIVRKNFFKTQLSSMYLCSVCVRKLTETQILYKTVK